MCQLTFGFSNGGVRLIYSAIVRRRWRADGRTGSYDHISSCNKRKFWLIVNVKEGKEKKQEANGRRRGRPMSTSSFLLDGGHFGRCPLKAALVSSSCESSSGQHWSHNCIIATFLDGLTAWPTAQSTSVVSLVSGQFWFTRRTNGKNKESIGFSGGEWSLTLWADQLCWQVVATVKVASLDCIFIFTSFSFLCVFSSFPYSWLHCSEFSK